MRQKRKILGKNEVVIRSTNNVFKTEAGPIEIPVGVYKNMNALRRVLDKAARDKFKGRVRIVVVENKKGKRIVADIDEDFLVELRAKTTPEEGEGER